MDDLNDLLHHEQKALLLAAHTRNSAGRFALLEQARALAVRIASHPAPYRTPCVAGAMRFNPGRFGASPQPIAKLFRRRAK